MSDKVNVFGDANVHFDEAPEARYHPPNADLPRSFIELTGPASVNVTVWADNRVATSVTSSIRTRGAAYLSLGQARQVIDALESALLMAELAEVEAEPEPVALDGAA